MKKTNKQALRQKGPKGLYQELQKKQKELMKEKMKKALNKGKDLKNVARVRAEIAVIKTIIRERQLEGEV